MVKNNLHRFQIKSEEHLFNWFSSYFDLIYLFINVFLFMFSFSFHFSTGFFLWRISSYMEHRFAFILIEWNNHENQKKMQLNRGFTKFIRKVLRLFCGRFKRSILIYQKSFIFLSVNSFFVAIIRLFQIVWDRFSGAEFNNQWLFFDRSNNTTDGNVVSRKKQN